MLYKFGSNLEFKMNGKFVIKVNSGRRSGYTAGDLRFASRHDVAVYGIALARERAPSWLP